MLCGEIAGIAEIPRHHHLWGFDIMTARLRRLGSATLRGTPNPEILNLISRSPGSQPRRKALNLSS